MRDPWSGHQVRFERRLQNAESMSGPYSGESAWRSPLVVAAIGLAVVFLLAQVMR